MSAEFPRVSSLLDICERVDGTLSRGDANAVVKNLASLESARTGDLSFMAFAGLRGAASRTRASAVVTSAAFVDAVPDSSAVILVADPYMAYSTLAQWVDSGIRKRLEADAGVAASAVVAADVRMEEGVYVGPMAVIEAGVHIGAGTRIGAGTVIGPGTRVGSQCRIAANVSIAHGCELGDRIIVHSGTVIGSDGFGFAPSKGGWSKIPQLGKVVIGDDVEIGANCSIDRGALDPTVIGRGCKLDNLIQIAHNVRIGPDSALAGCVGVAGSAVIGARCRIGGGAGILGHLEICDDVTISAMSLVTRSIATPGFYTGVYPLQDNAAWEKSAATLKQLPRLRERLRQLEKSNGQEK